MHDLVASKRLSLPAVDAFSAKLSRQCVPTADIAYLSSLAARSILTVDARNEIGGPSCGALHVLLSGWACKVHLLPDGRRQIATIHLPGDICDLASLGHPTRPQGVLALTRCRVAAIRHDLLACAKEERPSLADYLFASLLAENAAMARQVVNLGRRSACERTADLLCDLLDRLHEIGEGDDDTIRCPLTQSDMADHLGLSAVHTNRALRDLKTRGLLGGRGSLYIVRDLAGLRAIAGL